MTTLKQGDTAPKVQAPLTNGVGGPAVDLTGASVQLRVMKLNGTFVFVRTAAIVGSPTNGLVEYQWTNTDAALLTPGAYDLEWRVTFADTRIETFPQRSKHELLVKEANPAA